MNRRLALAAPMCLGGLLVTAMLVGGCSLKKSYPAKQAYLLEARREGEARTGIDAAAVLRVRQLQIATPFQGKGFVYRDSDLSYRVDFYHEFLVAPRALLTEQTRQWLGASELFRFVLDPAAKIDATHSLEGNVTALYGDFRESGSPKAVLAIEFFLTHEQSAASEIVFHKSYRQEVALENRAPETLAGGWGKALAQILTALEQDLARTITK